MNVLEGYPSNASVNVIKEIIDTEEQFSDIRPFISSYAKVEGHDRKWGNKCGGHVYVDHSTTYGKIDVYASILKDFEYKPTFHVNYENSILHIKDGLPKFKDFPEPLGGSGEMMDE